MFMALLAEYGRECAGAVVVMPSGEGLPTEGHPSSPLSEQELAELIDNQQDPGAIGCCVVAHVFDELENGGRIARCACSIGLESERGG